jgi:uncharacterized tellurite resistance protein B-like protein
MTTDLIPFLANIALVAHADGKLSASELGQLEAIRADLKMKKGDFNKAITIVGANDHKLTAVGTFADQVMNLELMLRVAYADDDLDRAEADLIADFCRMIGITQEQIDRLEKEILNSLKQQKKMCVSCGALALADAKFCPRCGVSLEKKELSTPVEFEIPKSGIAIEFADSTAASFSKALETARASSGYQKRLMNKKTWHLATFPSGSFEAALPLAGALSGIRNKRAFYDGIEKPWDEIFGFAWCATERNSAYRPLEYCFGKDENRINPWGCKQARMDWTDWADWFSYGAWEKGGLFVSKVVWRFNKERIRHELATKLFRYRFCPHMVPKLAQAVIRHLPDTVAPESDKNWVFNRAYEDAPGCIKVVEKEEPGAYVFTNEYWSDGVRPRGFQVLGDVLIKAMAEAGGCAVSPRSLFTP